ncbi:MAG: peptidoglycan binding protein CsiV [Sedimenticola sp.]|nr:peptidoglycan binding protein CsiV [Sedimenticola sp.]
MRLSHITCSLLLALLVVLPAQAAEDVTWYEIELILFKQGEGGTDTEQWPEDPGSPDWDNLVTLQPPTGGNTAQRQPFEILPESSWQLRNLYNGLRRSAAAEPLFYQAWRQPVSGNEADSRPIYLGPRLERTEDTDPTPQFEGTLRISVNRYFHVNIDLLLMGANRTIPVTESPLFTSPTLGSIRFAAKRRMRSGELHYIDHPKLGALIQISRIETEPATTGTEPQAPAADETESGDNPGTGTTPAEASEDTVAPQPPETPAAE